MHYLLCIPTFNEAENIAKLLEAISDQKLANFDILIIDDNSPDGTAKIAKKINGEHRLNNKVFVMDRQYKEGLGKAYVAGFKWALKEKYDFILGMDADFSHDPKYLPSIISAAKNNDVVIGSRYIPDGKIVGWNWARHMNSWGANMVTRGLLRLKPKDTTSGYRCYTSRFLSSIDLDKIIGSGYAFLVEMVCLAQENRFSIVEVPITFVDRRVGQSKIAGELPRSIKTVFVLALRKKSYREFVKFGIVGFSGTVVDLGVYNLLAILFGFNIYFSRLISFTLAATNNYIFNRKWTFRSSDKKIATQFGKFFLISVIGLLMNLAVMKLLQPWSTHFSSQFLQKNIPVLIAIIIVLIWNYVANKVWTFRK